MGLFSFLKEKGASLFGGGDAKKAAAVATATPKIDKAAMLKNLVSSLGLAIENFSVDVEGDKATLYGTTHTQADKEKVILACGNVEGIATIDDRISVTAVETIKEPVFYEVKEGDSLSKISKSQYGDPMQYEKIFEANKPMLSHPDKIYPGQVLRIP